MPEMKPQAGASAASFPPRTWGFRLSATDVAFIVCCLVAAVVTWYYVPLLAPLFPIACGHFFLFCNVFRVTRRLELIWTGIFLVNVTFWSMRPDFDWLSILAIQGPVTVVVVLLELRSARYHGIFARRLNPQLERWLQGELS